MIIAIIWTGAALTECSENKQSASCWCIFFSFFLICIGFCPVAHSNIDIRQLHGLYDAHKLQREECHSDSMQIACSHDLIWIVVGATQHGRSCFTGLAWQPSAIHWKRISSLESLQPPKEKKNESDKQCKKEGIAFWGQPVLCELQKAAMSTEQMQKAAQAIVTEAGIMIYLSHDERPPSHASPHWCSFLSISSDF